MPVGPAVIVTFYENLRIVNEDRARILQGTLTEGFDEIGTYLSSTMKVLATGGTWQINFQFGAIKGESPPLAWDASAVAIEAALNGTGIGVWTVTTIGTLEYEVRMHEPPPITGFSGMGGGSLDLTGHFEDVPHYDAVDYEVDLTEGCGSGAPEAPTGTIVPGGADGGAKPLGKPVVGNQA